MDAIGGGGGSSNVPGAMDKLCIRRCPDSSIDAVSSFFFVLVLVLVLEGAVTLFDGLENAEEGKVISNCQ